MSEKRRKINSETRSRILLVFLIVVVLMIGLLLRTAWIQVVKGEELSAKARAQQKMDLAIKAKRGAIYGRNGEQLASSIQCYTIWVRPSDIRTSYKDDKFNDIVTKVADKLQVDYSEVRAIFESDEPVLPLAEKIDKDVADGVKGLNISAIDVVEDSRRRYPLGTLAATVLGSVDADGNGRSGIEYMYDDYLSGVAGRSVTDTDITGNALAFGESKYYAAQDGFNVVLTIDEMLQQYLDDAVKNGYSEFECKQVMGMVMDPNNGEILAMSVYPTFDPNTPMKPIDLGEEAQAEFENLPPEDKTLYLSQMWRNPLINDVYEPGSTLKLITSSASIEEGLSNPKRNFFCSGVTVVEDAEIHDASDVAHGDVTLAQAVGESCNSVHIQLALELRINRYYKYVNLYGLNDYTEVDYPAESGSIVYDIDDIGPVELATMGFGQGIAITPIQLVTAVSSIANDGVMMKPHFVQKLTNKNGDTVMEFEPEVVRKVISKSTAREMLSIMEAQTEYYGGTGAKIEGYRIGGKTGTADQTVNGEYTGERDMSFISVAPIDDPQLVTLIVCSSPKKGLWGSETAIPIARNFLLNALPYKTAGINSPISGTTGTTEKAYVPDITGLTFKEAKKVLKENGLEYEVRPELSKQELKDADFVVVDQYPKGGNTIRIDEKVFIYRE